MIVSKIWPVPSLTVMLAFLISLHVAFLSPPSLAIDVVVVRNRDWSPAVQPWKAYREAQGYAVEEIDAELGRDAIRQTILEIAERDPGKLQFVLLAGDVSSATASGVSGWGIDPFYHLSTALVQFGGDASIATDNDYADLDGDHSPELSIGRIPADSPQQLQAALARSIAFEQRQVLGTWRRNVHIIAGVGGFGAVTDSVIELTTRRFLSDRIPGWSQLSMTQASLQSNYCPDPFRFDEACLQRMNEGGMFWVYIGHGHVRTLDYLRVDEHWLPIMDSSHIPRLQAQASPPIAVFLACYTGAFDAAEDSLAEQMVMSDAGPIAAIAASRVSGPYGLAMLSDGMLASCFDQRLGTLGEIVRSAKQHLLKDYAASPAAIGEPGQQAAPQISPQISMINALADALSPKDYDLRAERLEHVWQVNLLGDPLLRIVHPHEIELAVPSFVSTGGTLTIAGRSLQAGSLRVELANCRGRLPSSIRELAVDHATQIGRDNFQKRYEAANQPVIVADDSLCDVGEFERRLIVPHDLPPGKFCVRVIQHGTQGWQVGYCELRVRQ